MSRAGAVSGGHSHAADDGIAGDEQPSEDVSHGVLTGVAARPVQPVEPHVLVPCLRCFFTHHADRQQALLKNIG